MERTVASLALSAFVACCGLVLGLSWDVLSEPRPAKAQTTGTCPNPQFIDTFEGNGDQQTDTFNTTTNSLRVSYNVTGSGRQFPATLDIAVIDANDRLQLPVGDASQDGNGQGETFINSPAGTYYLDISFFDVDGGGQYTITVEQCEGGNPDQNPRPGEPPPRDPTPGEDQYTPKGPVDRPGGVIPRTPVRRVPPTGGPPIILGALVLLGTALIVGRRVLKR